MQRNPISWAIVIFTVSKNDCVKDKKRFWQQPVPGNLIEAREY